MDPVYLDHNATTPMRPEAVAAVADANATCGNASSVHAWGRRARARIEDARESVAALAGARPEWVIFTSGGSEANNLALRGIAGKIYASAIEHPSVLKARDDIVEIAVDADGWVRLDALPENAALVSVMLANNETGVSQPVARLSEIAKSRGALVHCDAVQAAGRIAFEMEWLGVDMLTLSAHKIGGPQGIGALIVKDGVHLDALVRGGGQERGLRAGTENVAAIAGFGAAATVARADLAQAQSLHRLRNRLESEIRAVAPSAVVFGAGKPRLPNTSCIAMPGVSAETQLMAFDLAGIMVSAGSACSSGKVAKSHVLAAMGVADDVAETAIRVSLGWTTTEADIARFVMAWRDLYLSTRQRMGEVA
jgi:cysteine desulfurase